MVQRQSAPVSFGNGGLAEVQSARTGFATPDPNRFAQAPLTPQTGDTSTLTALVGAISKNLGTAIESKMNATFEEEYLAGAAEAAAGKAEEMLETNPLTKDWKVAGWRDTTAKIASANIDANLQLDMKKLREQDPEEFAKYLAKQRKALLPHIAGMSANARRGMMAQRITWERQASTQHAVEHAAFRLEQKEQAQQVAARRSADNLTLLASKSMQNPAHVASYEAAAEEFTDMLYQNVIMDDTWSTQKKGDLIYEALQYALAPGRANIGLYDKISRTVKQDASGRMIRMTDLVSPDKMDKLASDYKQAKAEVSGVRNQQVIREESMLEARLGAADVLGVVPQDELEQHIQRRLELDPSYNPGPLLDKYSTAVVNNELLGAASVAYLQGNNTVLQATGKTPEEALDRIMKGWVRDGIAPETQAKALLDLGTVQGQPTALRRLGKNLEQAISNFGVEGVEMDPQQVAQVSTLLSDIQGRKARGNGDTLAMVLGGMSEASSRKVETYLARIKTGEPPATAWQSAQKIMLDMEQRSPAERAAIANSTVAAERKLINDFGPVGFFGTVGQAARSAASFITGGAIAPNSFAEWALQPTVGPLVRTSVEDDLGAMLRQEYAGAVRNARLANPYLTPEAVDREAKNALVKQLVPTDSGPLILPSGADPKTFFNLTVSNVDNQRIGRAISGMYPAPAGGTVVWRTNAAGKILGQPYDSSGRKLPQLVVDKTDLNKKLIEMDRDDAQSGRELVMGAPVKGASGESVNVSGTNSAGVNLRWMREWRTELVSHEDVISVPRPDSEGNLSGGVGILATRDRPWLKPGVKLTQQQIDSSFRNASNEAATAAMRVARRLNMENSKDGFRLLASMAYHGGAATFRKESVQKVLGAIQAARPDEALQALRETPQWRVSGAERRAYYEGLVKKLSSRAQASVPFN